MMRTTRSPSRFWINAFDCEGEWESRGDLSRELDGSGYGISTSIFTASRDTCVKVDRHRSGNNVKSYLHSLKSAIDLRKY